VKSLGARCQDRTGVGAIDTIPAVGIAGDTPFGPYDCPAGEAVVSVVGGAGGVLDSTALVCAPLPAPGPTVTSASPGTVAGFQYITLRGFGLPATGMGDILFSQVGGPEFPSDYVWTTSSTRVIARVPSGVLANGPATVRLKNTGGTVTTNSVAITISSQPGAPANVGLYNACVAGVATSTLNAGQQFMVEADGTGSAGTEFSWTNGVSTFTHGVVYTTAGPTGGVGTCATLPGGVTSGSWTLTIRSYTGAWSAGIPVTIQ
jgi:hypothetical protein